ncbi:MAG: Gfo/Idh/MocA family oxidoreductase [Verrucomicrobiota bacterium]
MKFGIIGTGMIANVHAHAIQDMPNGELVGVYGSNPAKTTALAEKFGVTAFSTLDEMLNDDSIDIVTVATPSGAHLNPTLAAIAAGKHLAIEKPLEITTERIDQMIAAAKSKGVMLSAILNRRFHPAMGVFKQAAENNRFGRLTSASAYIKWYRDQAYYDSGAWRGTWELDGGGALMNQSIHTIDALIYLAGPVKSVQATTACLAHENIDVEDIGVAVVEFANGARGVIEGSTCTWSKDGHPARVQLAGTEGSAFLADESFEVWDFMHETAEDDAIRAQYMMGATPGLGANDPKAINTIQHQRNFEEIVAAVQENRAPSTSAETARQSVELIEAIYHSAQNNGEKVALSSVLVG